MKNSIVHNCAVLFFFYLKGKTDNKLPVLCLHLLQCIINDECFNNLIDIDRFVYIFATSKQLFI